jgi:hypothetical protein
MIETRSPAQAGALVAVGSAGRVRRRASVTPHLCSCLHVCAHMLPEYVGKPRTRRLAEDERVQALPVSVPNRWSACRLCLCCQLRD